MVAVVGYLMNIPQQVCQEFSGGLTSFAVVVVCVGGGGGGWLGYIPLGEGGGEWTRSKRSMGEVPGA